MIAQTPSKLEQAPECVTERQRVLEIAGKLNRIGSKTERFLAMQFQQLERAIADFEHERAAWRRQQQREAQQLEELRNQLRQHFETAIPSLAAGNRPGPSSQTDPALASSASPLIHSSQTPAETWPNSNSVPAKGSAPLRVLLQAGSASRMQIGLLMFEASKLNRELGGQGVRFEVKDCRTRSGSAKANPDETTILEFEAFSHARLINSTEDLRIWETYKSGLLMSSLANPGLDTDFKHGAPAGRGNSVRELGTDAAQRAFEANAKCFAEAGPHGPAFQATGGSGAVRQQLDRLESLVSLLQRDHSLLIHVALV